MFYLVSDALFLYDADKETFLIHIFECPFPASWFLLLLSPSCKVQNGVSQVWEANDLSVFGGFSILMTVFIFSLHPKSYRISWERWNKDIVTHNHRAVSHFINIMFYYELIPEQQLPALNSPEEQCVL